MEICWPHNYCVFVFFFQAEDGIRDVRTWLEFRRVLFRSVAEIKRVVIKHPSGNNVTDSTLKSWCHVHLSSVPSLDSSYDWEYRERLWELPLLRQSDTPLGWAVPEQPVGKDTIYQKLWLANNTQQVWQHAYSIISATIVKWNGSSLVIRKGFQQTSAVFPLK